ncbi:twin-arginine translocase subunit TatC [Corynebacterium pseudopelargi]|uniref:Sec-independent protein translocase protein TatC n=1 Tax=Corynebacterium pseudopelargi TaxID=2080757 RepID=A0A3G6IZ02_9CORY|nr:twin-arginine translocase subunit TatC [Corynebacterium pseudopelargi]AZA09280.1 Sec-independent protein translocase protein TatC [Corynebacterium pseudopelargi]
MSTGEGSQATRTRRKVGKRKAKRNPQADMSLVEHLQELRTRVVRALIAIALGTVLGFIWYQQSFGPIPSLGDILRGPYCSLPDYYRADLSNDGECRLIATAPFEMFMLRLKVGALAGIVFSSPVWLWQIWGFVAPGMLKNERRISMIFLSIAVALFVLGTVIAYWVISIGLEVLLSMGRDVQITALSGALYFKFLLNSLVIFGISFEVPLFVVALNMVGVLHYEAVKGKRRFIMMTLFVLAAIVTPGQDMVGMTVLGGALSLLVELSFQFMRFNDKRRKVHRPEWMDVDDDESTPLDADSSYVGPSGSVGASGPIGPSGPVASSGSIYGSGSVQSSGPIAAPSGIGKPSSTKEGTSSLQDRSDFDDVI